MINQSPLEVINDVKSAYYKGFNVGWWWGLFTGFLLTASFVMAAIMVIALLV